MKETKFEDSCKAILIVMDNFDDEVFGDEEECKRDLRRFCLELLDKYKR